MNAEANLASSRKLDAISLSITSLRSLESGLNLFNFSFSSVTECSLLERISRDLFHRSGAFNHSIIRHNS